MSELLLRVVNMILNSLKDKSTVIEVVDIVCAGFCE